MGKVKIGLSRTIYKGTFLEKNIFIKKRPVEPVDAVDILYRSGFKGNGLRWMTGGQRWMFSQLFKPVP
jgi:hypothetical protein